LLNELFQVTSLIMFPESSLFLILLLCSIISLPQAHKVLVLGATGRVGSHVVSRLISQGIPTNILVRDPKKAQLNPLLNGANIYTGDVNNIEDIAKSCQGCDSVIAAHGMNPPRFTKLTDFFFDIRKDLSHPYNVNYLAMKKVIAVMEKQGIKKLVRITGSMIGTNPFHWIVLLFNFLLSCTVKYHELTEIAIRASNLDYTIIRSSGIKSIPRVQEYNQQRLTTTAATTTTTTTSSSTTSPPPPTTVMNEAAQSPPKRLYFASVNDETALQTIRQGRIRQQGIAVGDLADLCVHAITSTTNENKGLQRVTGIVGSGYGVGPSEWSSLFSTLKVHTIYYPILSYHRLTLFL
jgi:hypothetical protein